MNPNKPAAVVDILLTNRDGRVKSGDMAVDIFGFVSHSTLQLILYPCNNRMNYLVDNDLVKNFSELRASGK